MSSKYGEDYMVEVYLGTDKVSGYREARAAGYLPRKAKRMVDVMRMFEQLQGRGHARLLVVADDCTDFEDLEGDMFNVGLHADTVPGGARTILAQQKEFRRKVERNGVWGVVSEYRDPDTGEWEQADSCWGFAGYECPADCWENCYVVDLCRSAIDAYLDALCDSVERARVAARRAAAERIPCEMTTVEDAAGLVFASACLA